MALASATPAAEPAPVAAPDMASLPISEAGSLRVIKEILAQESFSDEELEVCKVLILEHVREFFLHEYRFALYISYAR